MNSSDEGLLFTDPGIFTDGQAKIWMSDNFPYASATVLSQVASLYPIPMQSAGRYLTEFDRLKNIIAGNFP
jgi:hypothetical protein